MSKPLLTGGNGKSNEFAGTANAQVPTWSTSAEGGEGGWVLGPGGGSGGGGAIFYLNSATAAEAPTTNVPYTGGSGATLAYFDPAQTSETFNATGSTRLSPPTGELPSDGSWAIVQGFLSDDALGLTALPPGLWDFNIWAQASTGAGTTQVEFRIRVGTYADGTNTLTYLFDSDGIFIYDPTVAAQYAVSVVIGANTIAATDRLYIEIDARASANNRTATFYFGSDKPSHVHTTIQVPVNLATDVTGILPIGNGGTGVGTSGGTVNADANMVFAGPNGSAGQPSFRALVAADVAGITPYDFSARFVGTPGTSTILSEWVADRTVTLTTSGWEFWCVTRPTTSTTNLLVKKNGTTIATFQFTTSATLTNGRYQGTLSGSITSTTLATGDFLTLETDTTVDAAFATPVCTIKGSA